MSENPLPPDHPARSRIRHNLDETLFVEAGAGSGKTGALVGRIEELVTVGNVPIEQIRTLENHPQRGIRLLDGQGNLLFAINYDSLLSADLFIALLEHMIHNRITAYHNPAMTRPSV